MEKTLNEYERQINNDSFFAIDTRQQDYHSVVKFVPSNLDFIDPHTLTNQLKESYYQNAKDSSKISGINQFVLSYIQQESDNYEHATHRNHENAPESAEMIDSYGKLNDLIYSFMGTRMGRKPNKCTLFDRALVETDLSDGQKVLLQLCVLLHAQGATLDNMILILDEPENHLHPVAQIEFIKKIKETLKNGQIWIATHSIHILSYLDASDIWYMKDGKIKYAGKDPEEVLNGLLGEGEQVEKLQDFIGLPSVLAANQFAYECLFAPVTSSTGPEDKQTTQIATIIENLTSKNANKIIRVLDFGAGKGRLISAIGDNKTALSTWLDYVAYDEFPNDKQICEDAIARIYGTSDNRYFDKKSDILGNRDEGSFDVVVMCNVLHEISPNDWVSIFNEESLINKMLSDDGYLLIIEDTAMPIGERPNHDGFFILNRAELKKLFAIPADDYKFATESHNNDSRLFAHLIPKPYLHNISVDSKNQSLEILKSRCIDDIKSLRSKKDYRSGKLLGLWSQQLANLIIYLK